MLYLIGVDHSVQHDGRPGYCGSEFERLGDEFPAFLDRVSREKGVTAIAEELSEDVLKKFGATKSVAYTVASQMNIKHMFCDPLEAEREQLDITKDLEKEIHSEKREEFWLKKLKKLKGEKIIFILGAMHFHKFPDRAKNAGFSIDVVDEFYGKEFFSPP